MDLQPMHSLTGGPGLGDEVVLVVAVAGVAIAVLRALWRRQRGAR